MNITFLIGNGFDINLGLNTKYSDFYPYFIEKSSETNMIRAWLEKDELLWADLEAQLGEKLENVKENERDKFYHDKAELDRLLLEYLEQEQGRISIQNKEQEVADVFAKSLNGFYKELREMEQKSIQSTYNTYSKDVFMYCFICFNYTNTLDQIVDITRKLKSPIATHLFYGNSKNHFLGTVLHVHGTLNEEMILGVNDEEQVNNVSLRADEEFLDIFIKRRMNDEIGQGKTERAQELIDESHVICIFGMSLGGTDKMWWEKLIDWLIASEDNKLVIYYKGFEEQLDKRLPANTIPLNKQLKQEVLEKGGADMNNPNIVEIKKRIFISYNANIFNFNEAGIVCPF